MSSNSTVSLDPAYAAESITLTLMAILTTFQVISFCFVVARLIARCWVVRAPWIDDVCAVCCMVISLGAYACLVVQAKHGLGRHLATIAPTDYVVYNEATFFFGVTGSSLSLGLLRLSIAFNLLRLCPQRWYQWALRAVIGFTVLYTTVGLAMILAFCRPVSAYWLKGTGQCYSINIYVLSGLVNTACNIVSDLALGIIPLPIVWRLRMRPRLRAYVIGIFSLGYIAVIMGIIKAVYQITYGSETDKTFKNSVIFWIFLEIQVGLVAACAPTLKPLVGRMLRLTSTEKESSPRDHSGGEQWPPTVGHIRAARPSVDTAAYTKTDVELDEWVRSEAHTHGEGYVKPATDRHDNFVTFNPSRDRKGSNESILHGSDVEGDGTIEPAHGRHSYSF